MGRQFRMFVLPSDFEAILAELRHNFGIRILADAAPSAHLLELATPYKHWESPDETVQRIHVYLAQTESRNVFQWYAAERQEWLLEDDRSEVIQISGFDFYADRKLLIEGRFYFRKDFVTGNAATGHTLVTKSAEFLRWADQVFRTSKKGMRYSKHLMAYIGRDADEWRKSGGRFAYGAGGYGKIPYADEPHLN